MVKQQIPGEVPTISLKLSEEAFQVIGHSSEALISAAEQRIMAALLVILSIHQKTQCIECYRIRILPPYFDWLNTKGYKILKKNTEESYDEFMKQTTLWALAYSRKEVVTICCDESPSQLYN
jgi:hypothetical protein